MSKGHDHLVEYNSGLRKSIFPRITWKPWTYWKVKWTDLGKMKLSPEKLLEGNHQPKLTELNAYTHN